MDSKNPRKPRYKNLCKIYKWQTNLGEPAHDHLQLPSANFFYKSANTWWLSSSSFSKNDWSSTRWAEDLPASASTDTGVDETHTWPSHSWSRLVFTGPVLWTKKRPQLDWTATEKEQFVSNWLQLVFDYIIIFLRKHLIKMTIIWVFTCFFLFFFFFFFFWDKLLHLIIFCAICILYNFIPRIHIQNPSILCVISHKNCCFQPFLLVFNCTW